MIIIVVMVVVMARVMVNVAIVIKKRDTVGLGSKLGICEAKLMMTEVERSSIVFILIYSDIP